MARFRLFGRTSTEPTPPPPPPPPAWPGTLPAYGSRPWTAVPPVGAGAPPRPATRAARPVRACGAPSADDRPTDPYGMAPVPARPLRQVPLPDPREAAALAGAFALDYLSWDEDDPARRGRVLAQYLSDPGGDPARLGWSGHGRQRAELALPGLVRPAGDGRVLVDVRVRVTPYAAVGKHGPEPDGSAAEVVGVPAVAPAPAARGWRSLPSEWVRLSVPVTVDGDRAVVDVWDEALGADPARPAPAGEAVPYTDDPLADPADPGGSAW